MPRAIAGLRYGVLRTFVHYYLTAFQQGRTDLAFWAISACRFLGLLLETVRRLQAAHVCPRKSNASCTFFEPGVRAGPATRCGAHACLAGWLLRRQPRHRAGPARLPRRMHGAWAPARAQNGVPRANAAVRAGGRGVWASASGHGAAPADQRGCLPCSSHRHRLFQQGRGALGAVQPSGSRPRSVLMKRGAWEGTRIRQGGRGCTRGF